MNNRVAQTVRIADVMLRIAYDDTDRYLAARQEIHDVAENGQPPADQMKEINGLLESLISHSGDENNVSE